MNNGAPKRLSKEAKKGVYITDRDVALFKYLAYGPAFEDDLHVRFFVSQGALLDRDVFLRRMRKLVNNEYLKCHRSRNRLGKAALLRGVYALGKMGTALLLEEDILAIERIRNVKLVVPTLNHEVVLARFIRKIYEGEPRKYQVFRMWDHLELAHRLLKMRRKRIPDLKFTVQLVNGSFHNFLVEIDAGTTHPGEFMRKILAFMNLNAHLSPKGSKEPIGILIVCHTQERMAKLQRDVMQSSLLEKNRFKFLFNTIYAVDNHLGLYNAWYRADGRKIDLIFKR